jgi:hypothetical protein
MLKYERSPFERYFAKQIVVSTFNFRTHGDIFFIFRLLHQAKGPSKNNVSFVLNGFNLCLSAQRNYIIFNSNFADSFSSLFEIFVVI